jgi:hypothetical protein
MKMTACNVDLLACVRPSDAGRDGSPGGFDTQMALLRCMLNPCPEEVCGMRLGDSPGSLAIYGPFVIIVGLIMIDQHGGMLVL